MYYILKKILRFSIEQTSRPHTLSTELKRSCSKITITNYKMMQTSPPAGVQSSNIAITVTFPNYRPTFILEKSSRETEGEREVDKEREGERRMKEGG